VFVALFLCPYRIMKTRAETVAFIEKPGETDREKGGKHHYGKQDLRTLLDYIYESPPLCGNEQLNRIN
jgi:hypothetical protein